MMSPLSFIVMLLIMIIIPSILYSFFFLINCPPNPFRGRPGWVGPRGLDTRGSKIEEGKKDDENNNNNNNIELVVARCSKLGKDSECPVCLSVFMEGEELKQLKICKHLFHKICIDKWLSSHFNCPVCRAFVSNLSKAKVKETQRVVVRESGRDDFWQGLPDSAGLV